MNDVAIAWIFVGLGVLAVVIVIGMFAGEFIRFGMNDRLPPPQKSAVVPNTPKTEATGKIT